MSKDKDKVTNDEEMLLREKARQALKKNKTPVYSPDDEGGLMAGPETSRGLKKDLDNDE